MKAPHPGSSPEEDKTTKSQVTLDPLRENGADSLDTHDIPNLKKANLILIEIASNDEWKTKTTKEGNDLFASSPPTENPAGTSGDIIRAIVAIFSKDSATPARAHLIPPDTHYFEDAIDLQSLENFLTLRHFKIPKSVLKNVIILLFAVNTSATPEPLDNGPDDDDDHREHPTLVA